MSSEAYEVLQDDLEALLERIDASLEWLSKKSKTDYNEQKSGLSRCQSQVLEARSLLADMEKEARSAPATYRNEMMSKVRSYRETVSKVQKSLRKKEDDMAKDKLMKGAASNLDENGENELTHEGLLKQASDPRPLCRRGSNL